MSAELKLIQGMIDRLSKKANGAAVETAKRAAGIHDGLFGIRESITKRAADEQRNADWLKENVNKAFGAKFAEIARLRHQNDQARKNHAASKPKLPEFDRSDVFAAMQTMELAKRVAATTDPTKRANLSPSERLAALRMPEIAGISPTQAEVWENEILGKIEPAKIKAYTESAEALAEADRAIDLVRLAFQREAGFIDRDTGFPSPLWRNFEREQMSSLQSEFEGA
jgi:hypothetical protein